MDSTTFDRTKTATVSGTTLAYREEGQGEPVVFVHGAFSDLRNWAPQLSAIGRTHRAIAYSCRLYRPNKRVDPGTGDLSLVNVKDLAALLRELGASPAHLVGNSSGALVCLAVASRYPSLVRSVVAEEPPALALFVSMPPRPPELLRVLATRPHTALAIMQFGATMTRTQKLLRRGADADGARVFLRGVLGEAAFQRMSPERWAQALENLDELRALARGASVLAPIDDDGVLAIRAPVLLLTGEHSPAFLLRMTDRLEELLPNAERQEIQNASHLMHEDNPLAVNQTILGFLRRHSD